MRKKIIGALFTLAALGSVPLEAYATPVLQLDIAGGTYDYTLQSIVTDADQFTVYALIKPTSTNPITDSNGQPHTYYISVAISPAVDDPTPLGYFTFNGTYVDVTGDMYYGIPPYEELLSKDKGDLGPHGIYPTYFREFAFTFSSSNRITEYNSQDDPGANITPNANGTMYYAVFSIDRSGLDDNYGLHFDLYNSSAKNGDVDITKFAPFSHDAETVPGQPVPEPATLLLMGSGLTGLYLSRKLRKK